MTNRQTCEQILTIEEYTIFDGSVPTPKAGRAMVDQMNGLVVDFSGKRNKD